MTEEKSGVKNLIVESISAKSAKKYQKHIFLSFPVNFEQIGATDHHSVVFPDSGTKTVGTVWTSAGLVRLLYRFALDLRFFINRSPFVGGMSDRLSEMTTICSIYNL